MNNNQNPGVCKNVNIYWLATTGLALWFLFVHSPPILIERRVFPQDPLFMAHLMGAGGIYLACIHNTLLTPSTSYQGRSFLPWHVWVGRIGMGLGVLGVVTGVLLTWTRIDRVGLSFGIPITIGGIFQLYAQWQGYRSIQLYRQVVAEETKCLALMEEEKEDYNIYDDNDVAPTKHGDSFDAWQTEIQQKKKKYLANHIGNMIAVFVAACGIPAMMRVLENVETIWPYIVVITTLNVVSFRYAFGMIQRIPDPSSNSTKPSSSSSSCGASTEEGIGEGTRLMSSSS